MKSVGLKRVLHVTDCFNGGVAQGIKYLISSNPHLEHTLLWSCHDEVPAADFMELPPNTLILKWNGNYLKKILILKHLCKSVSPEIIHAHSSIAGLLVRLISPRRKIYYSPHCFAFERTDISNVFRLGVKFVEFILSFKTKTFLCNWPNEFQSSCRFAKYSKSSVAIIALFDLAAFQKSEFNAKKVFDSIGTVGRIRPQKDPIFFTNLKREISNRKVDLNWHWLGSGDQSSIDLLQKNDILVHSWANRQRVLNFYREIFCLVVTSAWESGPLTMIESIMCGTPVVLRANTSSLAFRIADGNSPDILTNKVLELLGSNKDLQEHFLQQKELILEAFLNKNTEETIYKSS